MFLRLLLSVVVVAGLVGMVAAADDQAKTHKGIVVSVDTNKLTMSDKDGSNEHAHTVPTTATITCDGKVCRLEDLKKGMEVSVTTAKQGDKTVVTRVDAKKTSS